MANIIISYHASVTAHDTLAHLKRFVTSATNQNHQIVGVFLYQDAIFHASQHFSLPSDELQVSSVWQEISQLNIPLTLCITAAEKRGLQIPTDSPFVVGGLAEFAMDVVKTDKWVQFK